MPAQSIADRFLETGYVIQPAESRANLDAIRAKTAAAAAKALGIAAPTDAGQFLNQIHERVTVPDLNRFRLAVINGLLNDADFRALYLSCARKLVETIVGSEFAIQRNMGLSVQLPGDDSSILPVHSDTWGSECSPFEIVLWIPMVDCARTKAMFLLPPERDRAWKQRVPEMEKQGIEAIFKAIEADLIWTEIKYGDVMVFTPTLMHGNRVNREPTTRWSFNIRCKGLFTPYANKKLGDFFVPAAMAPASRIGLAFEMPPEVPGMPDARE